MKSTFRLITLFIITILFVPFHPAAAQEQSVSLHISWVDTSAYPQVTVYLSAWNADGLPLVNLDAGHFWLLEDKGSQKLQPQVVQVDQQAPLSVVLVMDTSGSMAGAPLQDAKSAAARFIDRLEPGKDQVALIAFADEVEPDPTILDPKRELAFSSDMTGVYNLVEVLEAGSMTHLYNAASKSVRMFEGMPEGHRAILLLSDGRNEPPEIGDPEEAVRLAKLANVPFFVVGLGNQIDAPYLQRLALETGGLFRAAPRSSELAQLYADMAALLKTQYRVTYNSTLPQDGKAHTINLTLNFGSQSAQASIETNPLPVQAPTLAPTELPPTQAPTQTSAATSVPPTQALQPSSTPPQLTQALPTPISTQQAGSWIDSPWAWPLGAAAVVALVGIGWLVIRRRSGPQAEVCAKCGYDMSGRSGACPQCGSTKRLPQGDK